MSRDARDLIAGLCTLNPSERLGNLSDGANQIKSHPFFNGVDWDALYYRRFKGPIVPRVSHSADASNFDEYDPAPESDSIFTADMEREYGDAFKDF